jgi:hypothetical protein
LSIHVIGGDVRGSGIIVVVECVVGVVLAIVSKVPSSLSLKSMDPANSRKQNRIGEIVFIDAKIKRVVGEKQITLSVFTDCVCFAEHCGPTH